jgi:hypothetical protein
MPAFERNFSSSILLNPLITERGVVLYKMDFEKNLVSILME